MIDSGNAAIGHAPGNEHRLADRDDAATDEHQDGHRNPEDPLPSAFRRRVEEEAQHAVADDEPNANSRLRLTSRQYDARAGRTIKTNRTSRSAERPAMPRILPGSRPGYLPPSVRLPHGAPRSRATWKQKVIDASAENVTAAAVGIIPLLPSALQPSCAVWRRPLRKRRSSSTTRSAGRKGRRRTASRT